MAQVTPSGKPASAASLVTPSLAGPRGYLPSPWLGDCQSGWKERCGLFGVKRDTRRGRLQFPDQSRCSEHQLSFSPEAKIDEGVLVGGGVCVFASMANLLHTPTQKHTLQSRSKCRLTAIRAQRCFLLSPSTILIYTELWRDYEFITLIHK